MIEFRWLEPAEIEQFVNPTCQQQGWAQLNISETTPTCRVLGAFDGVRLVGFAKVVDDGGVHGFLLDPMVSLALRRRGVGTDLVLACVAEAKRRGIEWLHVDFEPPLEPFYRRCGFVPSMAGVMNLQIEPSNKAPVQIDR